MNWLLSALTLFAIQVNEPPGGENEPVPAFVLDGVILTANPVNAVALVRRPGASRARALRLGQEYDGFVLFDIERDAVVLLGPAGELRIGLDGGGQQEVLPGSAARSDGTGDGAPGWIRRTFSRSREAPRLDKEIPVILSDTELTPRVRDGEIRGLELLRIPDGTLVSELGLRRGDVIRSINGEAVLGLDSLWRLLVEFQGQGELRLVVERRGETMRLAYALTN